MNRTLLCCLLYAFLLSFAVGPAVAQSPPSAPSGLRTVPASTSVTLYWNTSAGATSYNIYRSSSSGGEGSTPLVTNASVTSDGTYDVSCTDSSTAATTTYFYEVTAVNSAGQSGKSNEASATTGGARLLGPATVTATPGNTTVALSWSSVSGATSYNILRSYGGGSNDVIITGVIGTTYNDSGLTNGVTYTYSVAGVDVASEGYATSAEAEPEASTFTIGATPTSVSVNQGSSGTSSIKLTNLYGFTGTVVLTDSGLPSGVTASFSPSSISGSTASTFTLTSSPTAAAGTYTVTLTGTSGSLVETKSVTLTIVSNPILTSIVVAPATATVPYDGTQQFTATGRDQFGNVLATQPSFNWTASSGAITTGGLFTASEVGGPFTITATAASVAGTASVTVSPGPVIAVQASATPNPVTGTTTALSVLGASANGESTLTYLWSVTGPANVSFSANGSNAAKNATATFITSGSYLFMVTVTDGKGLTTTSSVNVIVNQTLSALAVGPNQATVAPNGTAQFSTLAQDQFGNYINPQPTGITWSVASGGTVNSSGLFTAGSTAGGPFTVTASSGSVNGSAQVTVSTGGTFTIGASPTSLTVNEGATGTSTITMVASAGFGQDVSLSASDLPIGVTATFSPQALSGNSSGGVTFTVSPSTAAGTYIVNITGTEGESSSTVAILLTVNAAIIPTTLDISPGSSSIFIGTQLQLYALVYDQNGHLLSAQPTTWIGASATGLFNGSNLGQNQVTAQADGLSASITITVLGGMPTPVYTHNGTWEYSGYSMSGTTQFGNVTENWPSGASYEEPGQNGAPSSTTLTGATGGSYGQAISVSGIMSATFTFVGATANDDAPPQVICEVLPTANVSCMYDLALDGFVAPMCDDGYTYLTQPTNTSTSGSITSLTYNNSTTIYAVLNTSSNTVTVQDNNVLKAALQVPSTPTSASGGVYVSNYLAVLPTPTITISSPTGTTFPCNGQNIPILITQISNLTPSFQLYVDGQANGSLSPGTHSVYVVETFGSSLSVQSNTLMIVIQSAQPGTAGIAPTSASCCDGQTFTFSANYHATADNIYLVQQWPTTVPQFTFSGFAWSIDSGTPAPGGAKFTTPVLSSGTHTIRVYLYQPAGVVNNGSLVTSPGPIQFGSANLTVGADNLSIATAKASPSPAVVNQTVNFLGVASSSCGNTPTYSWTFGDGSTGTGSAPTHTYTTANTYTVTVTAVDGLATATQTFSLVVQPPTSGFTLSASPASSSVIQNGIANETVSVTGFDGFTGAVSLSVSNLPPGVTATFIPTSITSGQSSDLILSALPTAAVGTVAVTVVGTSGSVTNSAWFNLTVTPQTILTSIALSPDPASVFTGGSQQFSAVAYDQNGLQISTQPSFTWTVSGGGSISSAGGFTAANAPGTYTVTGASGSVSGSAQVTVTAVALVLSSTRTLSIAVGDPASSTVSLSNLSGSAAPFALTVSGLPSGVTAAFSANSIAGSATSTLTFTAGNSAAAGTTNITVTATNGSQVLTTTVAVTVVSLAEITFSPPHTTSGQITTGTVSLTGPAPTGGILVTLTSSSSGVPATMSIPAGSTTATFSATFYSPYGQTDVTVTASFGGVSVTTGILVGTSTPQPAPAPAITSFSPPSGYDGTVVTITGTNMFSVTSVTFNGTPTTPTSISSDGTTVVASVPSGASTGYIGVTNGQGTGTSATVFTILSSFYLVGNPQTLTIGPYLSGSTTIEVRPINNFTGTVTLSTPAASGAWIYPTMVNITSQTAPPTATLYYCNQSASTVTIAVTGTGSSETNTINITVNN